jgi:NADH dehydrogenase
VGDLATLDGPQGRPLPGVASVAIQEAHHAVGSIDADRAGRPRGTFRYRNPGDLATIGRAAAVADLGWVRFAGWPAWLFWLFVHILKLTGFRNRLVVFVQWAWAYLTFQRSIRLITGRTGAARPPVSG